MEKNKIYEGNSLEILNKFPEESIDCVVTSPPYYGLRDYGMAGQFGLEEYREIPHFRSANRSNRGGFIE